MKKKSSSVWDFGSTVIYVERDFWCLGFGDEFQLPFFWMILFTFAFKEGNLGLPSRDSWKFAGHVDLVGFNENFSSDPS